MSLEYALFRADTILNILICPVMMTLSLVGNLLAGLVLSRRAFSSMPMSVYLRFLALMDVGTVITGLLPRFILALTDYDVRGTNEPSCQFQVYVVYVFTELSAWVLVIVTTERVLSIIRPHRVKIMCTKVKSYVIIAFVALLIIVFNSPIFVFFGKQISSDSDLSLQEYIGNTTHPSTISNLSISNLTTFNLTTSNQTSITYRLCGFRDSTTQSAKIWFLTHFVKQSLLPFVLIFTLNIVIILGLLRRRSALTVSCEDRTTSKRGHGSRKLSKSNQTSEVHVSHMSRKDASLSFTLVLINVVFLICNFPIGIYQQIVFNFPDRYENSEMSLVYSILVFVLYLNNSLNFILYSATGSRFRHELREMMSCKS